MKEVIVLRGDLVTDISARDCVSWKRSLTEKLSFCFLAVSEYDDILENALSEVGFALEEACVSL